MSTTPQYGDVVVRRGPAIIEKAPGVALMSPELFLRLDAVFIDRDIIRVGEDLDGEPVSYRITGWDADHKALIIQHTELREDPE